MNVVIFTEGGKKIGFGHISRCLALYQAFNALGESPFFVVNADSSVKNILKDTKYNSFNWLKNPNRLASLLGQADIALIDSYLAKADLYKYIAANVPAAVYIDDYQRISYPKGIVVNGSVDAEKLHYPKQAGLRYLLGVKYSFFRKEFWGTIPQKKISRNIKNILITFGGADSLNMIPRVLNFMNEKYPDLIKKVIIGKGFRNIGQILEDKYINTELLRDLSAQELKEVMLKADLAISAGGQTLYELARVGVPTIGICLAHNQLLNLTGCARRGLIKFSGWYNEKPVLSKMNECIDVLNYKNRLKMSTAGRKLVDGLGPRRVVRAILSDEIKKLAIVLRNATMRDRKDLWLWRNSSEARNCSFNSEPVLWRDHKEWFGLKLKNKKTSIYIAEQGVKKVGVIRFEEEDKFLTVSINLNPVFFGKGLGNNIIKIGTIKSLRECSGARKVIAEIVSDNVASKKAFKKAGYVFVRKSRKNGKDMDIFEFCKSSRGPDVF